MMKKLFLFFVLLGFICTSSSAQCVTDFTWTQTAPNVISFTNTSSGYGSVVHFHWSFGDGTASGLATPPNHTYFVPGTYYVTLTMYDSVAFCGTASITHTVTVTGVVICNLTATSTATIASCSTCADGDATAHPTGGTAPYSYYWPSTGGITNYISGLTPGVYSCTITDANACTATTSVTVGFNSCNASYTSTITGANIAFTSTSTGTGPFTTYLWSFGDGLYGSGSTATHTYPSPGSHNACLQITDSSSAGICNDSYCTTVVTTVTIPTACNAYFNVWPDSAALHSYHGTNGSVGSGALTYLWSWGDGTSSTGAYPSHVYAAAGTYNICLTVSDAIGCTDTYCSSETVLRTSEAATMISINILSPSGISSKPEAPTEWSVFPNPSDGTSDIMYTLKSPGSVTICIQDLLGNTLFKSIEMNQSSGEHTLSLNQSQLAAGTYLINLESNGEKSNKKLVILK